MTDEEKVKLVTEILNGEKSYCFDCKRYHAKCNNPIVKYWLCSGQIKELPNEFIDIKD